MDWPSSSPDINPIENLWGLVKRNVEKRKPRNLEDLKVFMVEEWEKIPQETIKNLINSMKNRYELILENNDDRIGH